MERKGDATAQEVPKLNNCKAEDTIYISNNLPYIRALEYGHSKQAPNGMVGTTIAGIKDKIERFVKENV